MPYSEEYESPEDFHEDVERDQKKKDFGVGKGHEQNRKKTEMDEAPIPGVDMVHPTEVFQSPDLGNVILDMFEAYKESGDPELLEKIKDLSRHIGMSMRKVESHLSRRQKAQELEKANIFVKVPQRKAQHDDLTKTSLEEGGKVAIPNNEYRHFPDGFPTHNTLVTPENIGEESYYNLVQLAKLTGFADPLAAIKATNNHWTVSRDKNGNIVSLVGNRVNAQFTEKMMPGQTPYTDQERAVRDRMVSDAAQGDPGEAGEPRGLPAFKVFYEDGESYVTSMSKGTTIDQAKQYFIGQSFEQHDNSMKKVVDVQPVKKEIPWPKETTEEDLSGIDENADESEPMPWDTTKKAQRSSNPLHPDYDHSGSGDYPGPGSSEPQYEKNPFVTIQNGKIVMEASDGSVGEFTPEQEAEAISFCIENDIREFGSSSSVDFPEEYGLPGFDGRSWIRNVLGRVYYKYGREAQMKDYVIENPKGEYLVSYKKSYRDKHIWGERKQAEVFPSKLSANTVAEDLNERGVRVVEAQIAPSMSPPAQVNYSSTTTAQPQIPAKPTVPAPPGKKYILDKPSNTWVVVPIDQSVQA